MLTTTTLCCRHLGSQEDSHPWVLVKRRYIFLCFVNCLDVLYSKHTAYFVGNTLIGIEMVFLFCVRIVSISGGLESSCLCMAFLMVFVPYRISVRF